MNGLGPMIISKTPLRVSFLGGGSDYKSFFEETPGCVLGSTINQYVYITLMPLPVFAEEKFRFTYRITESVDEVYNFKHPVVREVLKRTEDLIPFNIATMANLPGRSGLGSSSSFTVGLINALETFREKEISPKYLAEEAVNIERNVLLENGGYQDQYHAAFGGLRSYRFKTNNRVDTSKVIDDLTFIELLSSTLILVPVSGGRDSSAFAKITEDSILDSTKHSLLKELARKASSVSEYLLDPDNSASDKLGRLSDEVNTGWQLKEEISGPYENKAKIEEMIKKFKSLGATAGRLCGAGGSGFILLMSEIDDREILLRKLEEYHAFAIEITNEGSQIILNESDTYNSLGVVH
jgi:D-glycero-alpha-D-manno-heptose-7-phosphate kinase